MKPAISVQGLSFCYPDGVAALTEISFQVARGECVGLLGPNGSGKSTLLRHLNGILPERLLGENGPIQIDGTPVTSLHLAELRRQIGLLFQDPDDQLFCSTVAEDVAFGPQQLGLTAEEIHQRVQAALQQVGLGDLAPRPPHHLSIGEKRRACLAGVLACDPSILVLDEPSSGLDPRGRRELITLLRQITTTKLIATHDLELVVELCPRSLILDRGRIIADGPTTTLLSDEALMLAHGLERPHVLQHAHPHRGEPR